MIPIASLDSGYASASDSDSVITPPPLPPTPSPDISALELRVQVVPDGTSSAEKVHLHPGDLVKLGGSLDSSENFVQLSERVYRVETKDWIKPGAIGLARAAWSTIQNESATFRSSGTDCVSVALYHKEVDERHVLESIDLEISVSNATGKRSEAPLYIQAETIGGIALRELANQYVSLGQKFEVFRDKEIYHLTIVGMTETSRNNNMIRFSQYFGFPKEDTTLNLIADNPEKLKILQGTLSSPDTTLIFEVTPVKVTVKPPHPDSPAMIDIDAFTGKLRSYLQGTTLNPKDSFSFTCDLGFFLVTLMTTYNQYMVDLSDNFAYAVAEDQKISVYNTSDMFLFASSDVQETDYLEVAVNSLTPKKNKTVPFFLADTIKNSILKANRIFVEGQSLKIETNNAYLTLGIGRVAGRGNIRLETMKIHQRWRVAENAKIVISKGQNITIPIVGSDRIHDIKKLALNVEIPWHNKRYTVSEDKIIAEIRKMSCEIISSASVFTVRVGDGPKISCKVSDFACFCKPCPSSEKLDQLGKILSDTPITVTSVDEDLLLASSFPRTFLENPHTFLEKLGVGGMPPECIDELQNIILMRSKDNSAMKASGLKCPKGILLSGPPGTGKTNLARQLGKILGVPDSRITMKVGPEFFNKYYGTTEKRIRNLFLPAKKEQKLHGDDSQLHVVIIDEIDGILGTRDDEDNDMENRAVNQFIAELDGPHPLNNIFVVGITNRPEIIDPAVVRPGRLHPTITIGMPTVEGRKAIFRIHTRALKENNRLHDDVDFDKLAAMTADMSGAAIEQIVKAAFTQWNMRYFLSNQDDAASEHTDGGKIRMKDFQDAVEKVKRGLSNQDSGPPPHLYL